ncbi:helix-turn-helix transcriptional regulator [uncultured Thiodictyon sp.]|uniref:helix-turn-helix domain-containing protein n=1 Tax=uncultured Thiodictyon sp. TaxID=1846217 RepID=UPI0025E7F62B|nr:helix-turn-helix transcriptional regulator [uncultured Thiodictyon sp.]
MLSRYLATTSDPGGRLATHAGVLTAELPSDQGAWVKVRNIRQALGWIQETLERSAGIRQAPIGMIARGKRYPSLARLCEVAQAVDVARLVAARADVLGAAG